MKTLIARKKKSLSNKKYLSEMKRSRFSGSKSVAGSNQPKITYKPYLKRKKLLLRNLLERYLNLFKKLERTASFPKNPPLGFGSPNTNSPSPLLPILPFGKTALPRFLFLKLTEVLFCAPSWGRSNDLSLKRGLLYQLSYGRVCFEKSNCFNFECTFASRSHVLLPSKTGEAGSQKFLSDGERIICDHDFPTNPQNIPENYKMSKNDDAVVDSATAL